MEIRKTVPDSSSRVLRATLQTVPASKLTRAGCVVLPVNGDTDLGLLSGEVLRAAADLSASTFESARRSELAARFAGEDRLRQRAIIGLDKAKRILEAGLALSRKRQPYLKRPSSAMTRREVIGLSNGLIDSISW